MRKPARRNRFAAALLAATLPVLGCAGPTSAPGIDDTANFAAYKTYAYASERGLIPGDPGKSRLPAALTDEVVRREIDRDLKQRGWRRVPSSEGGDVTVAFAIGVPPRPSNRNLSPNYAWAGWVKTDDRIIADGDFAGRISITLVDRRLDKTLLYGYTAEEPAAGADLELVLAQAVTKIMAMLPPAH